MANFHSRSNSLPTQSHPLLESVEDSLCRLKSSDGASTSATSVCTNLASLKDLHRGINNLIEMSSSLSQEQGECWINELLEGSLRLVDLCGFSRDILCLTKEAVQNLESSIRRNAVIAVDMDAYMASRNNITKMINKYIKNLKAFNQNSTPVPNKDNEAIRTILKETECLDLSVLKSVLMLLSGDKKRSNQNKLSLLSKFTQTSRVHSEIEEECSHEDLFSLNIHKSWKSMDNLTIKNMSKKLKASEMMIQEVEEGLECLFRNLIKTRVSLLNVVSHLALWIEKFFVYLTTS